VGLSLDIAHTAGEPFLPAFHVDGQHAVRHHQSFSNLSGESLVESAERQCLGCRLRVRKCRIISSASARFSATRSMASRCSSVQTAGWDTGRRQACVGRPRRSIASRSRRTDASCVIMSGLRSRHNRDEKHVRLIAALARCNERLRSPLDHAKAQLKANAHEIYQLKEELLLERIRSLLDTVATLRSHRPERHPDQMRGRTPHQIARSEEIGRNNLDQTQPHQAVC